MKTVLVLLCGLCLATAAFAQAPAAPNNAPPFTSQELDQLLGPIALYPDSLIGLVLPASTVPSDIVMADRYMAENGDPAQIPNQPWDDSVKGLTHYPNLLKWLDQNLNWTTQLGTAFLAQPGDVMDSIQQLRSQALATGALANNDQQQVVMDNGDVLIEPTNPDDVYVPQYDPDAAYDDDYSIDDGPVITYDGFYPAGPWLYCWPDWRRRGLFVGDGRHHGRVGFAGNTNDPTVHPWRPNPNRMRAQYQIHSNGARQTVITRPQALPGVALIHSKHPTASGASAGLRPLGLAAPQRDYTGRGVVSSSPPGVVARPVVVQPQGAPPDESAMSGYGRGSYTRAASERGEASRQTYGAVTRPFIPAAPVESYRAPVETYSRPSAPAFQSMGSGVSAGAAGARGAASRGR